MAVVKTADFRSRNFFADNSVINGARESLKMEYA